MKHNYKVLIRQLAVFAGVIGVSTAISSLLPKVILLSSVSWNLWLF